MFDKIKHGDGLKTVLGICSECRRLSFTAKNPLGTEQKLGAGVRTEFRNLNRKRIPSRLAGQFSEKAGRRPAIEESPLACKRLDGRQQAQLTSIRGAFH